MKERNDITRRSDETFRTLLIIVTITMTFCFNLYKDALSRAFYLNNLIPFVISILLWSASNITNGNHEYFWKFIAWHYLIIDIVAAYFSIIILPFSLPKLTIVMIQVIPGIVILFLSFFIYNWLMQAKVIPENPSLRRLVFVVLALWTGYAVSSIVTA